MPALHLNHLGFSYTSAVSVIDDVSMSIGSGWTGVVGANGAGKTTLLRLVAGELIPSAGSVVPDPAGAIVTLCAQDVDRVDDGIRRLVAVDDGINRRWMGLLGLTASDLMRWETLSPGERKRWQLAGALATQPDVLLLDEPTNHVDDDGRSIVVDALRRFEGVGLVVSHDRRLLDELTEQTIRVDRTGTRLWGGSYAVARTAWEAEEAALLDEYDKLRRRERAARRRLADERRVAEQRIAARARQVRRAGLADRDARSMEANRRHASGEKARSQQMRVLRTEVDRIAERAALLDIGRELGGAVFFDWEPSPKRVLLRHTGPLVAGDALLVADLDVAVGREDRIRLTGPNGAGKSTLLRSLLASSTLPAERIMHLDQELTVDDRRRLSSDLRSLPPDRRGRVLSIVALLGVDPDALLATDAPSPGEGRKLALALGLGTGVWVLLLDEPTNHFDLPAIERLETALDAYPGAMVLVTHDEDFAAATTTTGWHLDTNFEKT